MHKMIWSTIYVARMQPRVEWVRQSYAYCYYARIVSHVALIATSHFHLRYGFGFFPLNIHMQLRCNKLHVGPLAATICFRPRV